VLLALRYYGRQMARLWRFTVPAMLLPALGNTCIYYVAPLIVAQLVGRFAGHALTGIGAAMPYVLGFVGVLLFAEIVWRIGLYGVIRLEGHGIENLYVIGMDELLAKDAAFFHDNFAGSLTKRVLSFASRFEDFTDNLVFNIVGSLVPLAFASVVLWRYDPLLVAGLIGLIAITGAGIAPLIRRRRKLVDQREEAIARVSGHVADSLMNMDTIRAFAAEDREAAEHRSRVADQRRKTLRSWDYEDISKLRQSDLRSLIAYVPQDPAMFHRTLRDNIAFARPHATDAESRPPGTARKHPPIWAATWIARVTVVTAPERLFGSRPGRNKPWLVPCHTTFALSGSASETRQCGYRHLSQSLNSGVASVAVGRVGEPWRHLVAVDSSR
jgi:ABC-type multidrug transport system fused ATPase/permease subunit